MKKVFLILTVFIFGVCSTKKVENPKGLYTAEQVAVFLKDLYILEAQVKDLKVTKDSAQKVFDYYEKELLKKHNMEDSLYRESFKYYMDDVPGLTKVYEIIADSLSLAERVIAVGDAGDKVKEGDEDRE